MSPNSVAAGFNVDRQVQKMPTRSAQKAPSASIKMAAIACSDGSLAVGVICREGWKVACLR